MACIKTETAMSRQEADLIAVLIFTYDSTRLLIHSGGTAVRDESLGRVPHSNLFVAEQIQIIQQFWAEGSTLTRSTRLSVGSLLSSSIRTDRIVRGGSESESRHPLSVVPTAPVITSGNQLTLSPI